MINPCKNCKPPKRNAHCHSECNEYLDWQEKHEEELKQIRNKKWLNYLAKK